MGVARWQLLVYFSQEMLNWALGTKAASVSTGIFGHDLVYSDPVGRTSPTELGCVLYQYFGSMH